MTTIAPRVVPLLGVASVATYISTTATILKNNKYAVMIKAINKV